MTPIHGTVVSTYSDKIIRALSGKIINTNHTYEYCHSFRFHYIRFCDIGIEHPYFKRSKMLMVLDSQSSISYAWHKSHIDIERVISI